MTEVLAIHGFLHSKKLLRGKKDRRSDEYCYVTTSGNVVAVLDF